MSSRDQALIVLFLRFSQGLRDTIACFVTDTKWRQDLSNLAVHLTSTAPIHTGSSLLPQVAIMIPLRLRSKEPANSHGDAARDEFCESCKDDILRFAQCRKPRR